MGDEVEGGVVVASAVMGAATGGNGEVVDQEVAEDTPGIETILVRTKEEEMTEVA